MSTDTWETSLVLLPLELVRKIISFDLQTLYRFYLYVKYSKILFPQKINFSLIIERIIKVQRNELKFSYMIRHTEPKNFSSLLKPYSLQKQISILLEKDLPHGFYLWRTLRDTNFFSIKKYLYWKHLEQIFRFAIFLEDVETLDGILANPGTYPEVFKVLQELSGVSLQETGSSEVKLQETGSSEVKLQETRSPETKMEKFKSIITRKEHIFFLEFYRSDDLESFIRFFHSLNPLFDRNLKYNTTYYVKRKTETYLRKLYSFIKMNAVLEGEDSGILHLYGRYESVRSILNLTYPINDARHQSESEIGRSLLTVMRSNHQQDDVVIHPHWLKTYKITLSYESGIIFAHNGRNVYRKYQRNLDLKIFGKDPLRDWDNLDYDGFIDLFDFQENAVKIRQNYHKLFGRMLSKEEMFVLFGVIV